MTRHELLQRMKVDPPDLADIISDYMARVYPFVISNTASTGPMAAPIGSGYPENRFSTIRGSCLAIVAVRAMSLLRAKQRYSSLSGRRAMNRSSRMRWRVSIAPASMAPTWRPIPPWPECTDSTASRTFSRQQLVHKHYSDPRDRERRSAWPEVGMCAASSALSKDGSRFRLRLRSFA